MQTQREREALGHVPVLLWVECFGVFKLRTGRSIQVKEWGYCKLHGAASKGHPRGRTKGKEARETVGHKGYRGSGIRNSHLFVSQWVVFQGRHLHKGASVSFRSCGPNKMDAEAAIAWGSSAKRPTPVPEVGQGTPILKSRVDTKGSSWPVEVSKPTAEVLMASIQQ